MAAKDINSFQSWLEHRHFTEESILKLLDQGFKSPQELKVLEEKDINELGFKMADRKRFAKAVRELNSGTITQESIVGEIVTKQEPTVQHIKVIGQESGWASTIYAVGKNEGVINVPDCHEQRRGIKDPDKLKLLMKSTQEVFVETAAYRHVEETLRKYGHVTISGASGEGKTSISLMLGNKYSKDYRLEFVDNIDKFSLRLGKTGKLLIIIDDIFGSVGLTTDVSQLKRVLQDLHEDLVRMITPVEGEIMQVNERRSTRKISYNLKVIFTTKTYNLQKAIDLVRGHASHAILREDVYDFFEGPTVLDLTKTPSCRYSVSEKRKIFRKHQIFHGDDANVDVEDICKSENTIFGFPLVCKLYFFKVSTPQKNSTEVFTKPLSYLRKELAEILKPLNCQSGVFILMLLQSSLNLCQLEMESDNEIFETNLKAVQSIVKSASRTELAREARNFRGTFFTDGDCISFSHPAIYDACACAFFDINASFILKYCSIKFLYERVHPESVASKAVDDNFHIIFVSKEYHGIIAGRLAEAVGKGHFSMSISHPILKHEHLVDKLFDELSCKSEDKHTALEKTFHAKDKERCFLYWAVHAQSLYLVKKILVSSTGFTDAEINEAVAACVSCVNLQVLEFLCKDFSRNISKVSSEIALIKACEMGNFGIFNCLLSIRGTLELQITNGDNLLHAACRGGETRILEHLLQSFDINCREADDGRTPVMWAAYSGHKKAFSLLMTKGPDLTLTDNFGDTVFHLAYKGNNASIVQELLPSFDINCRGQNGKTLLMKAAFGGMNEIFELLVKCGADITLTDNSGDTVLHLACEGGNTLIVENVLQYFNINCRGNNGMTPLMLAAYSGKTELFELLVEKGADLKLVDDDGDNVLHFACKYGNACIVENILTSFDVNCRGRNGWTPLMKAAFSGKKEIFDLLVTNGAEITLTGNYGNTVFACACYGGNVAIVEHLLPSFDINCRGENGRTPVMFAAISDKRQIFDLLERRGADLTLTDNHGDNVFHLACQEGSTDIVQHLLPSFEINCRGQNEMTPIMMAANKGKKETFNLLMKRGANISMINKFGDTVLHLACEGGNVSIVINLLPYINLNCRGQKGFTPIMMAVHGGTEVIDLLVSRGADLRLTDNRGNTVLHIACYLGKGFIVEHLLKYFNINSKGVNGWTPAMLAAYIKKGDVFDILVTKGADLTLTDNYGDTILHLACQVANEKVVNYLLPFFEINVRGFNKHTPLMKAVIGGSVKLFDLLLSHQADTTLVDNDKDGLLHLACEAGNLDMVKHVLPYIDVNMADKLGWTPPMFALVLGHSEIFLYLAENGADLTLVDNVGDGMLTLAQYGGCRDVMHQLCHGDIEYQNFEKWSTLMIHTVLGNSSCFDGYGVGSPELIQKDGFGNTLLHLACRGGNTQCVEHLLPCYDINVRGRYNWTPVMMAARCGHLDVLQCLLSHQADLSLVSDTGEDVLILAERGKHTDVVTYIQKQTQEEFKNTE